MAKEIERCDACDLCQIKQQIEEITQELETDLKRLPEGSPLQDIGYTLGALVLMANALTYTLTDRAVEYMNEKKQDKKGTTKDERTAKKCASKNDERNRQTGVGQKRACSVSHKTNQGSKKKAASRSESTKARSVRR